MSFEGFLLFLILKKRNGRDMNCALYALISMFLSWCSPDAHQFFATN